MRDNPGLAAAPKSDQVPCEAPKSAVAVHPKYRPDIDGLRAIAVLSVVIFHAFPKLFRGGFVGVDVFFVISGFLISTIIFSNLDRGTFSFADFYGRRVRRIFPALSVVLMSCFGFAWFYLLDGEFIQLGKHIAAGAGFVSNLVLWNESGYFDNSADTKPLLHLWSLGIEEQFYIVWPLLLWIAWKKRFNLLAVCVVVAVVSFVLNIRSASSDLVADFYSPQTRFWELMLGTILAYVQLHHQSAHATVRRHLGNGMSALLRIDRRGNADAMVRDVESLAGLVLILIGVFVPDDHSKFPGWWALLPTLGAVLVISAGPLAMINRVVLSSRILVWVGLISFPLYLWHWPLLSFLRLQESGTPPVPERLIAVAVAFALAWLTFQLIEKPLRKGGRQKATTLLLVGLMTVIGCLGYLCYVQSGLFLGARARPLEALLSKLERAKELSSYANLYGSRSCFQLPQDRATSWFVDHDCLTIKDPQKPTVFLWGDSHSASLSIGLRGLADQHHLNFLQMSSGWCAPYGNDDSDTQCVEMNRFANEQIRGAHPDVLILNAYWQHEAGPVFFKGGGDFIAHLEAQIAALKQLGVKKIIVVGQIPTWKAALPDILARRYVLARKPIPERTFADLDTGSLDMDARMRKMSFPPDTTYLSLTDVLCNDAGCLTSIGPDLETDLIVWDYGHLTRKASEFVTETVVRRPLLDALNIR